jgi:NAD(P)-dependent dehydrogenase (short-subunit alcohol dehydrogenase family)
MPHTILVTGSNKGIGYEAVKLLSLQKPQSTILLGSRSVQNGEQAIEKLKATGEGSFDNVRVLQIDVSDRASIEKAAKEVESTYGTLDVLLNNSGVMKVGDDWMDESIFDVNVRGVHDVLETFTPILTPRTAIVIIVSSQVGPWYTHSLPSSTQQKLLDIPSITYPKIENFLSDWNTFAANGSSTESWLPLDQGMSASKYFASKAILNPYIRHYASTHPAVKVATVCPGYCKTDMTEGVGGFRTPAQGGWSVAWPALNEEWETGKFYQDGKQLEWSYEAPAY